MTKAVRESVSMSSDSAVSEHVVDLVANNLDDLIHQLDGRRVRFLTGEAQIMTSGIEVRRLTMNPIEYNIGVVMRGRPTSWRSTR